MVPFRPRGSARLGHSEAGSVFGPRSPVGPLGLMGASGAACSCRCTMQCECFAATVTRTHPPNLIHAPGTTLRESPSRSLTPRRSSCSQQPVTTSSTVRIPGASSSSGLRHLKRRVCPLPEPSSSSAIAPSRGSPPPVAMRSAVPLTWSVFMTRCTGAMSSSIYCFALLRRKGNMYSGPCSVVCSCEGACVSVSQRPRCGPPGCTRTPPPRSAAWSAASRRQIHAVGACL